MPIIRAAVPADAEHIGRVHVQVWRETYPGIVPQTILDTMSVEARAALDTRAVVGQLDGGHEVRVRIGHVDESQPAQQLQALSVGVVHHDE